LQPIHLLSQNASDSSAPGWFKQRRPIRRDGVAKRFGAGVQIAFEDGFAIVVENVGEHASCVKIDATVKCVRVLVEAHG